MSYQNTNMLKSKTKKSRTRIVSFLNKYYLSKNISFGDIIHKLKPANAFLWAEYLSTKNWYLIPDLKSKGFNDQDIKIWMNYLKHSFWKLYVSETKAINYFAANFGIKLIRCSRTLDFKYGFDFKFDKNNFVIVKTSLFNNEFDQLLDYKQLKYFSYRQYNLTNSTIYVFISSTNKLYKYDYLSNNLNLILYPTSTAININ